MYWWFAALSGIGFFIVFGIFVYWSMQQKYTPSTNASFVALNYMKYNGPEWYAALAAFFMCGIIFTIFLNVIQFEIYNRLEVCHPYFYQSSACRKLISKSITNDPAFSKMKNDITKKAYRGDASAASTVNHISETTEQSNDKFIDEINKVNDVLQNVGPTNLGNLKSTMSSSKSPAIPSAMSQLKTLWEQTIVDPTMAKYVDPINRLYHSLA